jgi:type IV pilus assembly protein PilW
MPCLLRGQPANSVNNGSSTWWLDFFEGAVTGFEGGVSAFPAEFPAGASPGDRVAGADGIVILRGGNASACIAAHNPVSATFQLCNSTSALDKGDIVLVCDANHASLFQMSGPSSAPPHTEIVHNTGVSGVAPGNCTKGLGSPVPNPCTANGTAYTFGAGAQMVRFEAFGYYIGVSSSGTSRSLYRRSLVNNAATVTTQAEELLDGIENMQILYGVDTDADDVAEQYVKADQVTVLATWNDVVGVRIGLLVHTPGQVNTVADTTTYNVAGTPIADTGTTITHGGDRRLRYVFTSTVKVRNRGLL